MSSRLAVSSVGLALLLVGAGAWWSVELIGSAYQWQFEGFDAFSDVEIDLLRGRGSGLAVVALLALSVVCFVILVLALRRRPLAAVVVAGAAYLAAGASVQLVKHLMRPLLANPRWEDDLHLSGHVGVAVGTAALLVIIERPHQGVHHALVGWGTVIAAVAILFTGWHTLAQVVASLFVAAGTVVLVAATLRQPVFRVSFLTSPPVVLGALAGLTAAALGVRDGGAHRNVAMATSAVVVVGAAVVAFSVMAAVLSATLVVPDEVSVVLVLRPGVRTATGLVDACRLVAAAGAHRRDWLSGVGSWLIGPSGLPPDSVLAQARAEGVRPATWLVLRRATRLEGRSVMDRHAVAADGSVWGRLAAVSDRLVPPCDAAPAGALVRVLAETCRHTPAASLQGLLAAAVDAWRRSELPASDNSMSGPSVRQSEPPD